MRLNPLRLLLKESVSVLRDDERTALMKLLMVIHRCSGGTFYDPEAVLFAAAWEELNGAPTWESLGSFCDRFAADPKNSACMVTMRRLHEAHIGKIEDGYRDALMKDEGGAR